MKRLIFFLMVSAARGETVTLTPVKDTDVYSYPGNGKPTSSFVSLGVNSTPPDNGLHSQRSLIQFDLTGLPFPASEIESAVLRLFVLPTDPTYGSLSPGDVHVHRQGSDWGPVTATSPTWLVFQSVGEAGSFAVPANSQETWLQTEVTGFAKGWASGEFPNHGLFLAPLADVMSPSLNVSFASMEVPGYQPQLVITRKPPVLTIQSSGSTITLRWPVSGSSGWVLQRADSPAGPWVANASTVTSAGGEWQLQTQALAREFFRLAKN